MHQQLDGCLLPGWTGASSRAPDQSPGLNERCPSPACMRLQPNVLGAQQELSLLLARHY